MWGAWGKLLHAGVVGTPVRPCGPVGDTGRIRRSHQDLDARRSVLLHGPGVDVRASDGRSRFPGKARPATDAGQRTPDGNRHNIPYVFLRTHSPVKSSTKIQRARSLFHSGSETSTGICLAADRIIWGSS